jgi:hypothetical protein
LKGVPKGFKFAFETAKFSETWKEFAEGVNCKDGSPGLMCNHCSKVVLHPNRTADKSPSSLGKHLDHCPCYKQKKGNALTDYLTEWINEGSIPRVMTTDCLQEQVLRIIIAGNLPFYFAENKEFKSLLKDAYPFCNPPTRKGLADLLADKAQEGRAAFHEVAATLDCKIHLALDCWSTRTNIGYLGTTPVM